MPCGLNLSFGQLIKACLSKTKSNLLGVILQYAFSFVHLVGLLDASVDFKVIAFHDHLFLPVFLLLLFEFVHFFDHILTGDKDGLEVGSIGESLYTFDFVGKDWFTFISRIV